MRPILALLAAALLGAAAPAPVQQGVLIRKAGDSDFRTYAGQPIGEGDVLRTTDGDIPLGYADGSEFWLAEDTEVVYGGISDDGARRLDLRYGLMEALDGRFEIAAYPFEVEFSQGGVIIGALRGEGEDEVRVDAHPEFSAVFATVKAPRTGFELSIFEDQMVSLFHDPDTEATRVFVPEDSTQRVTIVLQDNPVEVLGGGVTEQEIFTGPGTIGIPPGAEVLIRRPREGFVLEEEEGALTAALITTGEDLDIPADEPFEDSGDVLTVLNVSPSQP